MHKQERRFTLSEVHTKMGTMGEVQLDAPLMEVLGIHPGDFLVFLIDKEGVVQVKADTRREPALQPLNPPAVTQASLFPDTPQAAIPKRRSRRR